MDDETNKLLRDILDHQREQTLLLRKHLAPMRMRFSLLALFIVMTMAAVVLGFGMFLSKPQPIQTKPLPTAASPWANATNSAWKR